ncbi:hypothetical protein [Nesterenkonia sp. CF4.4]|uniref:hypothetical protein n=1 Tax=Nesterenkonia sp. CF4.4 TaxID=3373079 RepID=UPI003EE6EA78
MTAENTGPNLAPSGDDLRARYLPVSRKELRRRREAELKQSRRGKPKKAAAAVPGPSLADESPDEPILDDSVLTGRAVDQEAEREGDVPADAPDADVSSPGAEVDPGSNSSLSSNAVPGFTTGSESASGTTSSGAPVTPWGFTLPSSAADPSAASVPVAAAEADLAQAEPTTEDAEQDLSETPASTEPADEQTDPEASEDSAIQDTAADAAGAEGDVPHDQVLEDQGPEDEVPDVQTAEDGTAEEPDLNEEDGAPVPADRLTELQELNAAVAAADDPHRVDPELLKKQQALAARAMRANQERLREEQLEADPDAKEGRGGAGPESVIITRKTLRGHMDSDESPEPSDHATGAIEPIQARGAHGLEIDAMVEHSTRQGARQSMMGWLVIILAVLLIITVGVVLSFIL